MSFLISSLISNNINEKAIKSLDSKEKLRIHDGFSNMRKYNLIPLILLVGAFFLINNIFPQLLLYTFSIYFILLIIFLIISNIYIFKKLNTMHLPKEYINNFMLSKVMQYIGIIILFTAIVFDVFKR